MAKTVEELEKIVSEQERQIRILKQAVMRLEQQVRSIGTVATRAQGKAIRAESVINTIKTKGK